MNKLPVKEFVCDLETGGTDIKNSEILSCAVDLFVNDIQKESKIWYVKPDYPDKVNDEALSTNGFTREQIMNPPFIPQIQFYNELKSFMRKYVDPFQKTDKFFFVGYNCQSFDFELLRSLWNRFDSKPQYFGSWFWYPTIDVMLQWASLIKKWRVMLPNFQQSTIAKFAKIEIDETRLHDAMYDISITRQLQKLGEKITNMGFEQYLLQKGEQK